MKRYTTIFLSLMLSLLSHQINAKTIYTGDTIEGIPVISVLDESDLNLGKVHRFWFKGASNSLSQHWYIPVIVIKGHTEGKRLGLESLVHGDEHNGLRTVQKVVASIDPKTLSGTVIAVQAMSSRAILANNRNWLNAADGGSQTNMNRVFPGKMEGNTAEQQAYLVFNQLWKSNVDVLIDVHTQSTGTSFPLFIYADLRNPIVKLIAELFPADQIKNDEGEEGTMETEMIKSGIPAITLEVGSPNVYQYDLIDRAVIGIQNVMTHFKMHAKPMGINAQSEKTFIGDTLTAIRARTSGFAEIMVNLGDDILKDQLVAVQRNAFGDVIEEYKSPSNGKVLSIGTHPVRESGSTLVRLLSKKVNPSSR